MESILERLTALETAQRRSERALRFWRGTALGLVFLSVAGSAFVADGRGEVLDSIDLGNRLTALEQTVGRHDLVVRHFAPGKPCPANPLSCIPGVAGDTPSTGDVTITGNLYVVNGLGSTATTNSSGNLIVGYNETGNTSGDTRTGSHNIIVGAQQSFSSYGGLVAGLDNTISGRYASVSGGQSNMASDFVASVTGGFSNVASGPQSSVTGGSENTATAQWASISGGGGNTASYYSASVSGGSNNTASGEAASVSGGYQQTASGANSWAAGGCFCGL